MQLLQFLQTELAPRQGRLENVLRITCLSVLLVILLETFQTPLPAYSAFILFFISKDEAESTILVGLLTAVSITIAVLLAIAIYTLSAGEPGLRLPLMAIIVFTSMFISRVSRLGTVAFITGFLVTVSLTLVDVVQRTDLLTSAEVLTRSVLWLWVVAMLPVGLVILANIFTGRDPADLFNHGLAERLELAGRILTQDRENPKDQKQIKDYLKSGTGELLRYLNVPGIFYKKLQQNKPENIALLAHTARVIVLLNEWMKLKISEPELVAKALECGKRLLTLSRWVKSQPDQVPPLEKLTLPAYEGRTVDERKAFLLLSTMVEQIEALPLLLASREKTTSSQQGQAEKSPHPLLVSDAFTNPDYYRYALKATLAIFLAYITYNLLDWPSIRTCMITCFFVSLGTFGETAQKMVLRIAGALIGGGLGLATIVFLMPHMTTITGLSLVVAVISFFAAWVATSSERLSYAGLQIAIAFFFSILVGYGPSIDLTESRDRVVGILLGNLIVFLVFTTIWPISAVAQGRRSLANALNKLSQLLAMEEQSHKDALFLASSDAISQAIRLSSLDLFEPKGIQDEKITTGKALIDAVQALSGPVVVLGEQFFLLPLSVRSNPEQTAYYKSLSAWFARAAEQVASRDGLMAPPPDIHPLVHSFEQAAIESSASHWLLACNEWYRTLNQRVHQLDTLVKKSAAYGNIPMNLTIKGAT